MSDESFIAILAGTVVAIVALCLPLWPGLAKFREVCVSVAYGVSVLAGVLSGTLKYTAAHTEYHTIAGLPPGGSGGNPEPPKPA